MKTHFFRLIPAVFLFVFFAVCASSAAAQTVAAPTQTQVIADENYQLNISESRTSEENYERSTRVFVGAESNQAPVTVAVGAGVRAERITISLRGVTGNVRFRASLAPLQQRIEKTAPTLPAPKTDNN